MTVPNAWESVRVGVLGLGRSGRAAARLLVRAGASVYASDRADSEGLRQEAGALRALGADVDLGGHDEAKLARCDLLVVSPGIPPTAEVFRSPRVRGRPCISELELAFGFIEAPIIAVTGTNGKTTTTAWIGAILEGAGLRVGVGGNIGRALSELAALGEDGYDWVVAEVSSFQLHHVERFRPGIGLLLNLCPDHLDWHPDVAAYYADKGRLFLNADDRSRWVLNGEDREVRRLSEGRPGKRRYFRVESSLPQGEEGAYLSSDGMLRLRRDGEETDLVERRELRLLGLHNVGNALAASLAATYADVSVPVVRAGLREFEPLPHRLQPVAERDGVVWIDDSKATNVASARVAVLAMERPTVLLLGGRGKGQSFTPLAAVLPGRVRAVVAYGEAAARVQSELARCVSIERVDGPFEDVMARAAAQARPGDAVLLAPACASFDMFRDYEDRGEQFTRWVREAVG